MKPEPSAGFDAFLGFLAGGLTMGQWLCVPMVLAGLVDMRLPLTFTPDDVALIARIIRAEALTVGQGPEPEAVAPPRVQ